MNAELRQNRRMCSAPRCSLAVRSAAASVRLQWRAVTSLGGWRRTPPLRSSLTVSSPSLSGQSGSTKAGGMEPAGAYGAGKAGSFVFDPVAFFTHPRTVLRLMSWVRLLRTVRALINGRAYLPPPPPPLSVSLIHIVCLAFLLMCLLLRQIRLSVSESLHTYTVKSLLCCNLIWV